MNPITKEGEILLRDELKKLKTEDRLRICLLYTSDAADE